MGMGQDVIGLFSQYCRLVLCQTPGCLVLDLDQLTGTVRANRNGVAVVDGLELAAQLLPRALHYVIRQLGSVRPEGLGDRPVDSLLLSARSFAVTAEGEVLTGGCRNLDRQRLRHLPSVQGERKSTRLNSSH